MFKSSIIKSLLLTSILIITHHNANAQKTITFEQHSSNKSYQRKKYEEAKKNTITIGLVSALNGYTPFYYERKITNFLSIQVGAGITYRSIGNDFGQVTWNDGKNSEFTDNSGSEIQDVADQYYHYKYRKSQIGNMLSLSPRIYFSDNCMEGFFLAPAIEWKSYKYKAQMADENKTTADKGNGNYSTWEFEDDDRNVPRSGQKMKEHMNCLDITVNIGGMYQTKNKLAIGWNVGLGLRSAHSSRLDVYTLGNSSGFPYYRNNERQYNTLRPLCTVNLLIGGCF